MKTLLTKTQIMRRIGELGREISAYYEGHELLLLIVANGGVFFGADLARALTVPVKVDVLAVSSYQQDRRSNELVWRCEPKLPVANQRVLIVDEVLDSGVTLRRLSEHIASHGALEVKTAVLVEKTVTRPPEGLPSADWRGFVLPDRYLVGCGMDSRELFRNLPVVAALD